MISARAILLFIAIIAGAAAAYANVPIIVETGAGRRTVMKLCSDASDQLRNGDIAGAKRNVDAALRIDPRLWPALYDRAQIFRRQGKYELAIQDCNEALQQYPGFVEAALFRNGQQAVRDAKAACSIMAWKDEDMIDTLAAAYAETGDFDSAVRYVAQALAIKGISLEDEKVFREHLAWSQQRKRIPVSQ